MQNFAILFEEISAICIELWAESQHQLEFLSQNLHFAFKIYIQIYVARIFNCGRGLKPQIACSEVIRNFRKEELFVGQRYRRTEDP